MNPTDNRIHLLDDISQSKITYSVHILSLNDVVLELVKNALDARAQNIRVVLNYPHGYCSVLDDGHGISEREFEEHGGLGKPFHTSKSGRALTSYGRNGRYLAALAGLSLLSIASRVHGGRVHVLWLDNTGRLRHAREPPDTFDLETGTRIKVYGLFSKLPVRSKAMLDRFASSVEVHREFDILKHGVLGLLLAASIQFNIVIEHASPRAVYRHRCPPQQERPQTFTPQKSISEVVSAFRQAGVFEKSHSHEWQEISIQSGNLGILGLISKLPTASKSAQYICLNHLPLVRHAQPELYHAINRPFSTSTFGTISTEDDIGVADVQWRSRPQRYAKGVDRWPMFVIWINTDADFVHDLLHDTTLSSRAQKLLKRATNLVQNMIEEFLLLQGYVKPVKDRSSRAFKARDGAASLITVSDDQRLEQSKEPFRHWSRVKSSNVAVLDNILTGLPFHPKSTTKVLDESPATRNVPATNDDSDPTLRDGDSTTSVTSHNYESNSEFGHVLWTDSKTGRVLRLDARIGMELSSDLSDVRVGRELGACNEITVANGHGVSNPRCRSSNMVSTNLSVHHVAANIQYHSAESGLRPEQSIRSISDFGENGQDQDNRCSTYKGKVESFWAMQHGGDHHLQLEAPNISREALRSARVLQQVDRKFLLTVIPRYVPGRVSETTSHSQLVLIDQHAADERCKVEALLRSVHQDEGIVLDNPIIFEVSSKESNLLDTTRLYFSRWNIIYEVSTSSPSSGYDISTTLHQVMITSLPSAIAERCRLQPRLIIDILRERIWTDTKIIEHYKTIGPSSTPSSLHMTPMPPRLLEMINSRACRSAIMFNDSLTIEQCEILVRQLSNCTLPFQCAHGRPSMVAVLDLESLTDHQPLSAPLGQLKSSFSTRHGRHSTSNGLNTIDNHNQTFGEAYHSWINSQATDVRNG